MVLAAHRKQRFEPVILFLSQAEILTAAISGCSAGVN